MDVQKMIELLDILQGNVKEGLITSDEMYWVLREELASRLPKPTHLCVNCHNEIVRTGRDGWLHIHSERLLCDVGHGDLIAYPSEVTS